MSVSANACLCYEKVTKFEAVDVNEVGGINFRVNGSTVLHVTLSLPQMEVLAEVLGDYLDKKMQAELNAAAAETDRAFDVLLAGVS